MKNFNESRIVSFKTYGIILAVLVILTLLSVLVTRIDLSSLTVFIVLLLTSIASGLVLGYFMHLKIDNRLLKVLVGSVIVLIALIMVISILDYNYR